MRKAPLKETMVPEVKPQTFPDIWILLEEYLPYSALCALSAAATFIVTVLYLVYRFKREGPKQPTPTGSGDKADVVEGDKTIIDGEGVTGDNPDTSEGQDGSEEDLPWILQKAPSETTLSEGKGNWTNDEKQSEGSESEKSQDFARVRKSAAGDRDEADKGVKVITADDEYICMKD